MAADSMTLDAAIATLSAQANLDGRGSEILAAAITLRDACAEFGLWGRGCKHSLRAMCRVWFVQRKERVSGKWKDRSVATLHGLLTCSVCTAAARWHPEAPRQTEHRGVTEHVSPGCSATGPQQSDQIHSWVSPVCNDDDDSDGYSDRKTGARTLMMRSPTPLRSSTDFQAERTYAVQCQSRLTGVSRVDTCGGIFALVAWTWIMRNSPWVLR